MILKAKSDIFKKREILVFPFLKNLYTLMSWIICHWLSDKIWIKHRIRSRTDCFWEGKQTCL